MGRQFWYCNWERPAATLAFYSPPRIAYAIHQHFTTVLPFAVSSSSVKGADLVRLFAIGGFTKRSCSLLLSLGLVNFICVAFAIVVKVI